MHFLEKYDTEIVKRFQGISIFKVNLGKFMQRPQPACNYNYFCLHYFFTPYSAAAPTEKITSISLAQYEKKYPINQKK